MQSVESCRRRSKMQIYIVTFFTPDQEQAINQTKCPFVLISYVNEKGWERAIEVKKEEANG